MDQNFQRYSCQVALPGFGVAAQQKIQQAKVLIVGAGGLGCPAAQYLAATGVGSLCIADDDVISVANLHRQILYSADEVGLKKAIVATNKLQQQNLQIAITAYAQRITSKNATSLVAQYDIIVDATDNFETKYLLNDACVLMNKPLVYGAIYQYEGQIAVWNTENEDLTRTPNYRDLFPAVNAAEIPNCTDGGVLPTLAGIIGSMQANEVIKYITGLGELLSGKLLVFDALTLQSRIIKIGTQTKVSIHQLTETCQPSYITANDLKTAMSQNSYWLVDVRSIEEREKFNIGGVHIPLGDLKKELSFLSNEKPVVFYCASGKRSEEAAKVAHEYFPFFQILSLKGGLKAWVD